MGVRFYCPEYGVVPDTGVLFCRKDGLKLTMKTTSLSNFDLTDEVKKLGKSQSEIAAEMQNDAGTKTEGKKDSEQ